VSALVTGVRRHALAARGHDLYETPTEAIYALLQAENLPRVIWEPSCGPGAIARVLRASGRQVIATDLVDYGSPDQDFARRDFLLEREVPPGVQAIVTNPPFKLANEFVEHALKLCPRVVMFLRLLFIESDRRSHILDCGRLARILVFANRVPRMHRDGWKGPEATTAIAYAWFVWDARHRGDTTIRRIRWSGSRNAPKPRCYRCGRSLPAGRVDRQWCSNACRQRAYRQRLDREALP
jgi:hypothetical protein